MPSRNCLLVVKVKFLSLLLALSGTMAVKSQPQIQRDTNYIGVKYYNFVFLDSTQYLCQYWSDSLHDISFKAFNRWGQKVVQATSLCFVFRDSLLIPEDSIREGAYFYQLKYKVGQNNTKYEVITGSFNILIDEERERKRAKNKSTRARSPRIQKGK